MMQDDDFSSDTSDEDFTIEAGRQSSDSDTEAEDEIETELPTDDNPKKRKKKCIPKNRRKSKNPLLEQAGVKDATPEKEQAASDTECDKDIKDTKDKAESLWADFMADVDDRPPSPKKTKSNSWASLLGNKKTPSTSESASSLKESIPNKKTETSKIDYSDIPTTVKVTKIFEFAGEEVRVEKEVPSESAEAKEAELKASVEGSDAKLIAKKPVGAAGIVNFLDNKKMKLTTLEKTKFDWDNFKQDKGLKEELESHKKSKAGYLDRKAFLERADVRQFEIERDMRLNRRSKR